MARKLLVMVLGILAGLMLAELVLRLTHAAPEIVPVQHGRFRLSGNPVLGYEPVPISYSGRLSPTHHYTGRSNSLGFRDIEHAVPKPEGVYRIVVIGDSIADGIYIPRTKDIFPTVMQTLLTEQGYDAEVINLSVSGYNTAQEVEMLRIMGLQFLPDLVLVAYCLNDIMRVDGGILDALLAEERARAPVNRYRAKILHRSAFYRFIRYVLLQPNQTELGGDQEIFAQSLSGNTVVESFRKLADMANQNGFDVLVVVFPNFRQLADYPYAAEHEKVRRLADANGFRYLDLLPGLQNCSSESGGRLDFDYIHPTVSGHRCIAGIITGHLAETVFNR